MYVDLFVYLDVLCLLGHVVTVTFDGEIRKRDGIRRIEDISRASSGDGITHHCTHILFGLTYMF